MTSTDPREMNGHGNTMSRFAELGTLFEERTAAQLAAQMLADLDLSSARIGAQGPPDRPGPEEDYIVAIERVPPPHRADRFDKLGRAVNSLLLDEVKAIQLERKVGRPFLLFNLCALLETVELPVVHQGLRDLRGNREPLEAALRHEAANLFSQLLKAHSVNQSRSPEDERFWAELLEDRDPIVVAGGVAGIRESGFEVAMKHLSRIEEKHRQYPEKLGDFADEIMLLVNTYADRRWPECATPFFGSDTSVWRLVEDCVQRRYTPSDDELNEVPGAAARGFDGADHDGEFKALAKKRSPGAIKTEVHDNWTTKPASIADRDRRAFRLICVAAHCWLESTRDKEWSDAFCFALRPAAEKWLKRFDRTLEFTWHQVVTRHLRGNDDARSELAAAAFDYCQSGLAGPLRTCLSEALGSHGTPSQPPRELRDKFDARLRRLSAQGAVR